MLATKAGAWFSCSPDARVRLDRIADSPSSSRGGTGAVLAERTGDALWRLVSVGDMVPDRIGRRRARTPGQAPQAADPGQGFGRDGFSEHRTGILVHGSQITFFLKFDNTL